MSLVGKLAGYGPGITRLLGKVAVITGAANGIGQACARKFVEEGARVIIADVDEEAGKQLALDLNRHRSEHAPHPGPRVPATNDGSPDPVLSRDCALFVQCDVTKLNDLAHTFAAAEKHFGAINVLVNNAGTAESDLKSFMDTTDEEWATVVDVNLTAVFRATKLAVPYLRRAGGGSIVNISSTLALVGLPTLAAYQASKGGVCALTRAAALSLIQDGIRVNAVCPGATDTRLMSLALVGDGDHGDALQSLVAALPIRRMARPEEIASSVLFLASDEASYVVGTQLVPDGGLTAM